QNLELGATSWFRSSELSFSFSVLSSQFSVLSSQFSVLSSQFSVLSSKFMQAIYSDRYQIDLGLHVFPTAKYRLIADRLSQRPGITLVEPEPATWTQLALVHTPDYLAKLRDGTLAGTEVDQLELPWSRA